MISLGSLSDDELTQHLRRTLSEVAATVVTESDGDDEAIGARPPVRRRRRTIPIVAVALVAVGTLAAWNTFEDGEIRRIPREAALVEGTSDGYDWWLIPSAAIGRTDFCGVPFSGAEIVSADSNKPGQEWNTMGVVYGEPLVNEPCDPEASVPSGWDEDAWINDPSKADAGMTRLGDNDDPGSPRGAAFAVHPSIDSIALSVDFQPAFTIATVEMPDRPDGPRFAATTVDADACIVIATLLTDNRTVGTKSWNLCN